MKEVYVVTKLTNRIGVWGDAFILNVFENKDDALTEARDFWDRSLEQMKRLEGAESIIEACEMSSTEVGLWRFTIITEKFIITYTVNRCVLKDRL